MPVADLQPHPDNPRRGDVLAIAESLEAHGQYRPITVQKSTGFVLAGNHTLAAARSLGWDEIDVAVIDVDDLQARKILLADNRTADFGSYDDEALLTLLQSLDDLGGTGFVYEDLDDLEALLEELSDVSEAAAAAPPAGIILSNTFAEDKDNYSDRATRIIVLPLTNARYAWLVNAMSRVALNLGYEDMTNSDVVVALVAEALDEEPPADDLED